MRSFWPHLLAQVCWFDPLALDHPGSSCICPPIAYRKRKEEIDAGHFLSFFGVTSQIYPSVLSPGPLSSLVAELFFPRQANAAVPRIAPRVLIAAPDSVPSTT